MKDYTFIRPGIAVSISAVTLVVALVIGFWLITSLRSAAATVESGARTVETLHSYNAGIEVWREMVTSTDPAYKRPEALAQQLPPALARLQLPVSARRSTSVFTRS